MARVRIRLVAGALAAGLAVGAPGANTAPLRHIGAERPADWLTDGGNPQRTAWQREETRISPATARDLQLLWTVHLDNVPRQMHALFPPLIAGRVGTPAGFKQ